ncbi:MAG: sulfatase-like hydrolase/transferase [Verrucomicrobiae bacterium]|nr:sulfatase-like hydrolase/transferase [Verrucomicrobiae bacterium]
MKNPCFPLAILCLLCGSLSADEKPNVIVIMADDMGYGDLSCYGAHNFETPNIDQLAAEGVRFTSGYCSASTCTPTRYSFLTGTYAFRKEGTGIAPPNGPLTIDPDSFTLPDLMKKAGYQTAVIGKWHLGLGEKGKGPDWNGELKPGPHEIGFDYNFLLPTTNDRVPQVYVENHRVLNLDPADPLWVGTKKPSEDHPTGITHRDTLKMDWSHGHNGTIHNGISRIGFYTGGHAARFRDEDLGDKWVEKSTEWIEQQVKTDAPFFLFFASHDLHVPRMPHERFQGATRLGFRADAIVELDWGVGELMKTLDRLGIAENTLVIYCSDNGPVMDDGYQDFALEKLGDHRAAGPYSGGKYSVYEGGTRTPFITRWKGHIEPGIVSDEMVCTIDIASSLAGLTGTEIPQEAFPDSFDVSGAMLGKPGAKGRATLVEQDNGNAGNFGFRAGDWKLQRHDSKKARNVTVEKELENKPAPRFQLFDLSKDPAEKNNVIEQHPDVAERMKAQLAEIIDSGWSRPQKPQ